MKLLVIIYDIVCSFLESETVFAYLMEKSP